MRRTFFLQKIVKKYLLFDKNINIIKVQVKKVNKKW
jgi:hypothetical protein